MKLSIFEILDDQIEAVQPAAEATPEVIEQPVERLPDEKIVELWEERSAIQETDNRELIEWWYSLEHPSMSLRRHCDLIAAADLSMCLGTYIEPIIRPLIEAH
jgi:hypothetical protein